MNEAGSLVSELIEIQDCELIERLRAGLPLLMRERETMRIVDNCRIVLERLRIREDFEHLKMRRDYMKQILQVRMNESSYDCYLKDPGISNIVNSLAQISQEIVLLKIKHNTL